MSCEQKSGAFLNESCSRTVTNTCSNCEKKICHVHFRSFDERELCEDCYWENYLYIAEVKPIVSDTYNDNSDYSPIITSSSSTPTSSDKPGFDGGFGGGEFGGGGASASWTEGEAAGFNETDADGNLLDSDTTFFYS